MRITLTIRKILKSIFVYKSIKIRCRHLFSSLPIQIAVMRIMRYKKLFINFQIVKYLHLLRYLVKMLKEEKKLAASSIGEYPAIPQQAFRYFPELTDQRQISEKGKIVRYIYHDSLQFQLSQIQELAKFDQYIAQQEKQLDCFWDRGWRLRWLASTNFNFEQTLKDIIWYDQFRRKNKDPKYTPVVQKYLESGCYYIGGRDAKYRPILVFDIKKIICLDPKQQQLIQSQSFFFDYVVQNILIPGQVQNWVCIIDNGFQGLFSFLGPMKTTINFLTSTYRSRMYAINLVNAPSSIYYVWKIIQKLLDPIQVKKINIFDDNKPQRILQLASPLQIEQKFGGKACNKSTFWPYQQISPYYEFKHCPTKLISNAEYQKKFKNMQLINTKIKKSLVADILVSVSTLQNQQKQDVNTCQLTMPTTISSYQKKETKTAKNIFSFEEENLCFAFQQIQLGPCLCQQLNF